MILSGGDADYNAKLQGRLSGVMTWYANVAALSSDVAPDGAARQLAVVDLTSHRQVGTAVMPSGCRAAIQSCLHCMFPCRPGCMQHGTLVLGDMSLYSVV
jgi:hypothetical protein